MEKVLVKSKVILLFLVMFLYFNVFVPKGSAVIATPPTGGSLNGAFIRSNYGINQYSMQIEDYYMKPIEASVLAKQYDFSSKSGFKWLVISFIKYKGHIIQCLEI
ncbi:hypothetical protein CN692_19850 [Bacillus sp. AFS002410]|uniref:hypothetical protein n=1 Tax=Bacillus sp. AFS002410 TaxID=2033481 RepID=UPI000BF1CD38|nr:hypothetical protein [Bacillus sp. AFS002410]PEJ54584.1 hypothetical protein CN692_19850 [Bacillus sp. AFS002410]